MVKDSGAMKQFHFLCLRNQLKTLFVQSSMCFVFIVCGQFLALMANGKVPQHQPLLICGCFSKWMKEIKAVAACYRTDFTVFFREKLLVADEHLSMMNYCISNPELSK